VDVSIIGASGDCGRAVAVQLIESRVLPPSSRLQLVGRAGGASGVVLYGLSTDLRDAYAEVAPEIDVALSPEEVVGDVIVMTAGITLPARADGPRLARADLARANLPLFHAYARALAEHGHGDEVVLIVSNPVELGVEVFSRYLGRRRVIGIGAYSDTLRFRREIAQSVGVRRQMVHAYVVGEHGDDMVPLWSSVDIYGMDDEEREGVLDRMRSGRGAATFPEEVARKKQAVLEAVAAGRVREAFELVDRLPPDLRVVIKPYVTHLSGAKTAFATAGVTVDLVRTLLDGREIVVAGQVRLDGEFYDIHTSLGVPIVVGNRGWTQVVPLQLWEEESRLLVRNARAIQEKLRTWQSDG